MATTLSIVVLALLLTGVAITTVYALPIISQATAAQASNGDGTQTQNQQQMQDRERKGDMTQTQDRLRLRDGSQNYNCLCEGSGTSAQGSLEQTAGDMHQNKYCEQTRVCSQNRNGQNLETDTL